MSRRRPSASTHGRRTAAFLLGVAVLGLVLLAACGSAADGVGSRAADAPRQMTVTAPTTTSPESAAAPSAEEPSAVEQPREQTRVRIECGEEPDNFAWLQLPAGEAAVGGHPVVVLVHGGFWRQRFGSTLMDDLADDLAARGYASWNIEYRRVGGFGGWPETGADVVAAIEHLESVAAEYPIDLGRVVSVGHSAGGHLALWALGREQAVRVRGAIGLGAVVDLAYFPESQGLLGGTVDEVPGVYADAAPSLDPERVVLVQGSTDFIVPTESLAVARDAGVPIIEVTGDDHFDLIDPASASWSAAVGRIDQFFED